MTDEGRLFDRPADEWSLRELELAAALSAQARDEAVRRGDAGCAAALSALSALLYAERDTRRALVRAADDACSPFRVLSAGLYPD